ncbi:LuxR family transcriptional regulator [Sulfurifustis variabilis]|uniref:LuxR family transcriptional regulator n=1 Tax=Sulfurifustis variabilis TaxID=1675686 RepID=A0A1C7AFF5_9GAMM|nr:response regulator transcription factor [Sulfurifustis variabilis]BAU50043.1 LuxR family transcriptional regulator [Sulfurifustis variabilis]
MTQKLRIMLAEDHTILRDGLRALLMLDAGIEVVGEVDNGLSALRSIGSLRPDLVLMDLSMPKMDGLAAIREIKRRHPEVKILALTVHKTEEYIRAALNAGADGYVLKDASKAELMAAIRATSAGRLYLTPAVSETIVHRYLNGSAVQVQSRSEVLSVREREVLKLIAEGYRNKEIATFLCVSAKTVEKHRANLMRKLDLHNVSALTTFAIENGLVAR